MGIYRLIRSLLSFFFSRLNSPRSLSLALNERCSSPLIIFVILFGLFPVCLCLSYWGPQSSFRYGLPSTEQRKSIISLDLLAMLCPMQPRRLVVFFAKRAHCWLMFKLVSTKILRSLFAKWLSSWPAPNICQYLGLFLLCVRKWHFPLLNFMRSLLVHFFILSRSLWMAAQLSDVSTSPPNFVITHKLAEGAGSCTVIQFIKEGINIDPSIDTWGRLLVTGLQMHFVSLITRLWAQQFQQFPIHFTIYLSILYFICLWMRMLWESFKSTSKIKINYIQWSFPLYRASHLILEGWGVVGLTAVLDFLPQSLHT